MATWRRVWAVAILAGTLAAGTGCGKSEADAEAEAAGATSAVERDAIAFAQKEVAKRWTKTPDGWATARTTALISDLDRRPGANRQSAPAFANAVNRRIVSSRSGLPTI